MRVNQVLRRLLLVAAGAFLIAGCEGDDGSDGAPGTAGADGQDAVDTGTISVTVTSGGNAVEGATVSTNPATTTADTDATGVAALANTPIGVYEVIVDIAGIGSSQTGVGVAAGATTDVALSVFGVPGTISGKVLGPDADGDGALDPVEGATVSTPTGVSATTDANGDYVLDSVPRSFLSVDPPSGADLLPGGTRHSISPGDMVDIELSGRPASDATYVSNDLCVACHGTLNMGLVAAWQGSGHYAVVERSLVEMDLNGWPADPGANLCSAWTDTGVDATDVTEAPKSDPTHDAYVRTCNDDPDLRFEILIDSNDNGADEADDTLLTVYATYGGPGTAAGELEVLQDRGEATSIHGTWKQRYMINIGDVAGGCSATSPEGVLKPAKPSWISWDTTQTCEDMLMSPIQFNQRTGDWVAYHSNEWFAQYRTYSKKCSGCHEAGLTLTADTDGLVTEYAAADYRIGCQKCHGPGSNHIAGAGDVTQIINPDYLTATSAREVCGQCHSRGGDPLGAFGFPWRSDVTEFDGNFVAGIHKLDFDAVDAPDGYFVQKPGLWPTGYSVKHRQQYNDMLKSSHIDNPWEVLTCHDCHSVHSGKGGPFQFSSEDSAGNEYEFGNNSRALMSNVRCLSCHATHGPFSTLTLDDIAVYHTARGGSVDLNGDPLTPSMTEQTSAEDLVEQAVKNHSGEAAGMPLAPYQPEESVIVDNYQLGEGPVGRCTSCHMTKTAKSGSWYTDPDGLRIEGDVSNHIFDIVAIEPGTDQPNSCGKCHSSFRTTSEEPAGGD